MMQTIMVVAIETVNLVNICAQTDIIEVVMNFVALAIVADFDDFVCKAITRNDKIGDLFGKNLLMFKVTTSTRINHPYDKYGYYEP